MKKITDGFDALLIVWSAISIAGWLFYDGYGTKLTVILTYTLIVVIALRILAALPNYSRQQRLKRRLQKQGVQCDAMITNIKQIDGLIPYHGQTRYKIYYQFEHGGTRISSEHLVVTPTFFWVKRSGFPLKEGDHVAICYLPDKPETNSLIKQIF